MNPPHLIADDLEFVESHGSQQYMRVAEMIEMPIFIFIIRLHT